MDTDDNDEVTFKVQKPSVNHNKDITDILEEVGMIEKNRGQIHKFKAYMTASNSLKKLDHRVQSGNDAKKLDGVGLKIAKKIQEILDTKGLQKLVNEKNDPIVKAFAELTRVVGVGPQLANKLVSEGVTSIEQLKQMKDKLNHAQLLGLEHLEDLEKRIPREEIEEMEALVYKAAKSIDPKIMCQACGSFRRGLPNSGDMDILLTHPKFTNTEKDAKNNFGIMNKLVKQLRDSGFLIGDLSNGFVKYMGICRLRDDLPARRIDLCMFTVESYFTGLLHFTGSGEHNRQLRITALEKDYKLSEYGLYPTGVKGTQGDPIPIHSEKDVFDILGLPYLEPHERCL